MNMIREKGRSAVAGYGAGILSFIEMLLYMSTPAVLLAVALILSANHLLYIWSLTICLVAYGFVMEILRRRLKMIRSLKTKIQELEEENRKMKKIIKRTKRIKNSQDCSWGNDK